MSINHLRPWSRIIISGICSNASNFIVVLLYAYTEMNLFHAKTIVQRMNCTSGSVDLDVTVFYMLLAKYLSNCLTCMSKINSVLELFNLKLQ